MNPEVGQVYIVQGRPQKYLGGDPDLAASWGAPDAPAEATPSAEEQAQARLSAGGGNALTDFLHLMAQGGSANFSDELAGVGAALVPGGKGYKAGRDKERQLLADLKLLNPGYATGAAELAGALPTMLVPGKAVTGAIKAPGTFLGAAARGAKAGAAAGGLFGFGAAEGAPQEQLKQTAIGAGVGAGLGAATAGLGFAATRRAANRGGRAAAALRREAGVPDDINVTRAAAADAVEAARTSGYKTFEKMDPVSQMDVAGGRLPTALKDRLPKGDISFNELQDLRSTLRGEGDDAAAGILSRFMERHFPGLKEADKIYAGAKDVERTLKAGTEAASKSGADIEWAARGLTPDQSQVFRTGLVQKTADALTMRDEAAGAMLKNLLDQGEVGARKVRQYFPAGEAGQAAYERFQRVLKSEASAAEVGKFFKALVTSRLLWFGGGGAAGALASRSLFR